MLYYQHYLRPLQPDLERVDLCLVEQFTRKDLQHARDEIEAALPDTEVHLAPVAEVTVRGAGQLLIWPVEDINAPGKLAPAARTVLRRGGTLALLNPRIRDIAVIEAGRYGAWRWRIWRIRFYEWLIGLGRRVG